MSILMRCSHKDELPLCKNNGLWKEDQCVCILPHYGQMCELLDSCLNAAPKDCNGFACETGLCDCDEHWKGNNCEILNPALIHGKYDVVEFVFDNPNQLLYSKTIDKFLLTVPEVWSEYSFHGQMQYEDSFHGPTRERKGGLLGRIDSLNLQDKVFQVRLLSEHWHDIPMFEFDCIWSGDSLNCEGFYFEYPQNKNDHSVLYKEYAHFLALKHN